MPDTAMGAAGMCAQRQKSVHPVDEKPPMRENLTVGIRHLFIMYGDCELREQPQPLDRRGIAVGRADPVGRAGNRSRSSPADVAVTPCHG